MSRALLLLAAANTAFLAEPQRVVLMEEMVRLEAMERRTVVQFPLEQRNAQLDIRFDTKTGGDGVQLLVYEAGATKPSAASNYAVQGTLRMPVEKHRTYRVEMANLRQGLGHGLVDLEVALLFDGTPATPDASGARTLDPKRRYFTVAISATLFVMIVTFSAIRLAPTVLERLRGE